MINLDTKTSLPGIAMVYLRKGAPSARLLGNEMRALDVSGDYGSGPVGFGIQGSWFRVHGDLGVPGIR